MCEFKTIHYFVNTPYKNLMSFLNGGVRRSWSLSVELLFWMARMQPDYIKPAANQKLIRAFVGVPRLLPSANQILVQLYISHSIIIPNYRVSLHDAIMVA